MRRSLGVLVVLVVLLVAGCAGPAAEGNATAPGEATTTPVSAIEPSTTAHPPDPTEDVLGWEDGYWYDESIAVASADGLNQSELDAVVARGMARVEEIRRLEFERRVAVEVISRSEYRERTNRTFGTPTTNASLHQDVKFEATFMMGESTSAIAQQESNRAAVALGQYSAARDRILIISGNETAPRMDEVTLAQELFHALQERHFNVSRYEVHTEETNNAVNGIVEGDANYVDHLYEQRCDGEWACVRPDPSGGSGGGKGDVHAGLLYLRYQPYSDGPVFVQERYEAGGWEAVNEVYEAPPRSTEQTIHPEKYRVDEPTNVTIEDRSTEEWAVPELGPGSVEYAAFGEAGLYVTLWYPSFVETRASPGVRDVVIPYRDFYGPMYEPGIDQFDYAHRYTAGWDGDRLLPYVRNDSATTGETGYVWKTVWDTEADAAEFLTGYEQLLEYHGAEPVVDRPGTYRIPEGEFADAFYVERNGTTVVIVNAPTVDELADVRAGSAPNATVRSERGGFFAAGP
ncbi:MAG: Hvo_1808 family surface protein [Halanaeroarchaeum sp.]